MIIYNVCMNQDVTKYIEKLPQWQQDVAESLRTMIQKAIPDIEEQLQYGKPHYLKNGNYAAVIHAGKDKLFFMVFNAENIAEVKGFLRSMGKGERKVVDITEGQTIDYDKLADLLKQTTNSL